MDKTRWAEFIAASKKDLAVLSKERDRLRRHRRKYWQEDLQQIEETIEVISGDMQALEVAIAEYSDMAD